MATAVSRTLRFGIALVMGGLLLLFLPGWAFAAPGNGNSAANPAHTVKTSPQPPSKADFRGHGANVHGPYDSTRNGSASGNGNGKGKALGKPCAGCVGKADNKNPRGQLPNGSDPNAGYECDRNHGVGRTNPAHTGCVTGTGTPTTPPTTTPPSTGGQPGSSSGSHGSQSVIAAAVPHAAAPQAAPGPLATTGTNTSTFAVFGLVLIGAGALLSLFAAVARRRAIAR